MIPYPKCTIIVSPRDFSIVAIVVVEIVVDTVAIFDDHLEMLLC